MEYKALFISSDCPFKKWDHINTEEAESQENSNG
jgi:hypothetical protein